MPKIYNNDDFFKSIKGKPLLTVQKVPFLEKSQLKIINFKREDRE